MKSGSALKTHRIILAIISVLLVLSSCAILTGSWFTDSQTIDGNFIRPVYDMSVTYYEDEQESAPGEILFTYTGDNESDLSEKTVTINIDSSTTVKKCVLRAIVTVEWGIMEDDEFINDTTEGEEVENPLPNILVPVYSEANNNPLWTGSREVADPTHYDYVSTEPTYYYYNNVIVIGNNDIEIDLFSALNFAQGVTSEQKELYVGKTAKITIIAELLQAKSILGYGWNTPETNNYEYGDCATDSWVSSINTQLSQLG